MRAASNRRVLWAAVVLQIVLLPARGLGFVDVALSGNLATAPRWSATEAAPGRGLADGKISVSIAPNFAENIAIAVTGGATPQDVADIEAAVRAAFDAWESPVLQFELTFDGAAVRSPASGAEIDVFDVLSTDPQFAASGRSFGAAFVSWGFLPNRLLTNGSVLAGNAIIGADLLTASDRLALLAPSFSREEQLRLFQRLMMQEVGVAIGLNNPADGPSINNDTDTNPNNAILIDPTDPLANVILSPNLDTLAVMNQIPPDLNALMFASLRDDDRGGRDVLYPALGDVQDVCQPMPVEGCRAALESKLQIRNEPSDDEKNKILWKWVKGAATAATDFGVPDAATRYSFCLYRGELPALLTELALPPGAKWTSLGDNGFNYGDAARAPHGVQKTLLKAGLQDKAKIVLKAKGPNVPYSGLPLGAAPVVAQLVRADTMGCWQGTYQADGVTTDDGSQFKAKQ